MKNIAFNFLFLLATIPVFAQSVADVDTFRVDGVEFIATTPADWFSVSTNDGLQQDTTWNYKMRYAPKENPNNLFSEIWMHIVNRSDYTPTKKEQKQFRKECKVSVKHVGNWPGYFLDYKGKKVKGCNACPLVYTQAYSIPLNTKQNLEIVFVGQGKWSQLYPLAIQFSMFASDFVKANDPSMNAMAVINFNAPMTRDTFRLLDYTLYSLVPTDFSGSRLRQQGGTSIVRNDLFYCIFLSAVLHNSLGPESAEKQVDTTIAVVPVHSYGSSETRFKMSTKRKVLTGPEKFVVITFTLEVAALDVVMLEYHKQMLSRYANRVALENETMGIFELPTTPAPDLKPQKKIDRNQPIKFEKVDGGISKPK